MLKISNFYVINYMYFWLENANPWIHIYKNILPVAIPIKKKKNVSTKEHSNCYFPNYYTKFDNIEYLIVLDNDCRE
jgi:hypothetical protein